MIPWFELDGFDVTLPLGLGVFSVSWYAILAVLGLFVAFETAIRFARRHGQSTSTVTHLAQYLLVFSFPISYLFNGLLYQPNALISVLETPSNFFEEPVGLSSIGGVAGGLLGALVWRLRSGEPLLQTIEPFVFATPFGWGIARIGCFLTHDHPGRVSEFFLAVNDFRLGDPPFSSRHDLGLYDAILLFAIAAVFSVLSQKPRPTGFYAGLLPLLYMPCRFALDFLRASAEEGGDERYLGLTPAQYAATGFVVLGVILMRRTQRL